MRQVNKVAGRIVTPMVGSGSGRTILTYPELETPGLSHGILVFKEATFGMDHRRWHRLVSEGLTPLFRPQPERIVVPHQIHSSRVIDADAAGDRPEGDGLVTSAPLTAICISVSDCVPLFAIDREKRLAGLAHCGWRGVAGGVVEGLLGALVAKGCDPAGITFLAGASVGPCCYEVGDDLLACFPAEEARAFAGSKGDSVFFDLKGVVASRLVAGGARAEKISIDNTCTSCKKYLLSSYRADGRDCGRMLAFMMLTE